jgi:hypothetical protein
MFGTVAAIAILVAARQIYLHTMEDLSTWKGGGMGMFAAADGTDERYAKIYLLLGDGQRQPLMRLTEPQEVLEQQALFYPTERNFRALADSIKATKWWTGTDRVPLDVFDENGQRVRDGTAHYYDLYPAEQANWGAEMQQVTWGLEIEYWEANYDAKLRKLKATLVRTFTIKG